MEKDLNNLTQDCYVIRLEGSIAKFGLMTPLESINLEEEKGKLIRYRVCWKNYGEHYKVITSQQ